MIYSRRTGVYKRCPVCGRLGEVYVTEIKNSYGEDVVFDIYWEGEPKNPFGMDQDIDWNVTPQQLFMLDFGCGYDDYHEGLGVEKVQNGLRKIGAN